MKKVIVFDMDGTIANLYGVEGWLDYLLASDPAPYIEAEPMLDMEMLCHVLNDLRDMGYIVAVTSWLSKNSTPDYDAAVRTAKREWLARYNFPADEIHLVKYGTTKANCTRHHGVGAQILFDDNAQVRAGWHLGEARDVQNIIGDLLNLIEMEG